MTGNDCERRSVVSAPLPSSHVTEPWIPPTASLVETAAGAAAGAWAAVAAPVLVRLVRRGLGPLGVSPDGQLPPPNADHAVGGDGGGGHPGRVGPGRRQWGGRPDSSMLGGGTTALPV